MKLRSCCFTINNPKNEAGIITFLSECKYAVFGRETGESGTKHLQGYCEFVNPRSFKAVHEGLEKGHLEIRKGSRYQAMTYCKKDGDVWEHGEPPDEEMTSGKRTDLDRVREAVCEGKLSLRSCVGEGVVANYQGIKMAEKLLELFEEPRKTRPKVLWFWGPSGTGKSYSAKLEAEAICDDVYYANANGKWFNGYDGHKCVVVNDFRYDWKTFSDLLQFLDENPYRVETKGGMRQFVATHIWITCPLPPAGEYRFHTEEKLDQLVSRCHEVREFTGVNRRGGTEVSGTEVGGNTIPRPASDPWVDKWVNKFREVGVPDEDITYTAADF